MAVNREELISCLNELIETCRDGEEGFQSASEGISDQNLKALFKRCSLQRAQFSAELQAEVRQLAGEPETTGSTAGSLHRGWINIKSAITGKNDKAIIAECERGEDVAVATYQRILKQNLPPNVLPVVKHQFTQIKETHDTIRNLEKAA
jgi:uncharacterized protein (TIGR02284 family)